MEGPPTRSLRLEKATWLGAAAAVALTAALLSIRPAHAAIHHAALVIQHSSGSLITRCVAFAEDRITGLQLIERSGLQHETQSFGSTGTAVCQLDREPSTVPSGCFGSGRYWQYFHRQGGGWQASAFGAGSSVLHDADMDAWHYADGPNQAPANIAFASVCTAPPPAVAATATNAPATQTQGTPAPVATPAPTASLEAPVPARSPRPNAVLTSNGPPAQPPNVTAIVGFGGMAILLLALGAINLRRRAP